MILAVGLGVLVGVGFMALIWVIGMTLTKSW